MSAQQPNTLTRPVAGFTLLIMTFLVGWLAIQTGPLIQYGQINYVAGFFAFLTVVGTLKLIAALLVRMARFTEWLSTHRASGRAGTADWATWKDLKDVVNRKRTGPFWGLLAEGKVGRRGKPLFIDFESNAMCIAPAGSGKGIFTVITNLFSIRCSKVIADFKGELACIMKAALEKRGEIVRILNPGGLWADILGLGDFYNPLHIIADSLRRPGGLKDVFADLRGLFTQIQPDPAHGKGDEEYFKEGGRNLGGDCALCECMIEGHDATLGAVARTLQDREATADLFRWVCGEDPDGNPDPRGPMPIEQSEWAQLHDPDDVAALAAEIRARAKGHVALLRTMESRTYDSFVTGINQALAPLAYGRIADAMSRSTFSMDELKGESPMNLFIVADSSRMEAYAPYLGLMQWCAQTAIKRHPNKERKVVAMLDECTNYKVHGLADLMTWGRGYGLKLFLVCQDISAFARVYGREAVETLLSETEIKLFLPGQRSPQTLELISKMLGERGVMGAGLSRSKEGISAHMSETPRSLLKPDEIRRSPFGLLFARRKKPALISPVSYAEIHPWRRQASVSPFHPKPFLKKVRLRLKR
ncbi:MAG: type IV secretory system conjugative DNA transfer family protein [Gammaproteobacteria bacterium]